jgi:protein-S-isoprenylcysteine O-methyltransferase Ste14
MKGAIKQIISFILPVTVLILIPLYIERHISVMHMVAFLAGLFFIVSGLFVIAVSITSFIRVGKGTLAPWDPPKKLITTGIYGYVRNPMIIGVMTALIGESIAILSLKIAIWKIIFFLLNSLYFVMYEEPNLENRFGEEYKEYKKNVPRWIPKITSFRE